METRVAHHRSIGSLDSVRERETVEVSDHKLMFEENHSGCQAETVGKGSRGRS